MGKITVNEIVKVLNPRLQMLDLDESDIDLSVSLIEQGILDSMSFMEFIVDLENKFSVEIDFGNLEPNEFTSINNMCKIINNEHKL